MVVMSMEPHGGVADQMTTLALELPKYGVQPVVLVRNPLSPKHGYAAMLRQAGIKVEAIRHERYRQVRGFCHILARLALPLAMADAALRRKTLIASQRTVWSILRRLGYAGLDLIFGLRLLRLRAVQSVRLVHFRKPDSWSWIARARRLGLVTIYTEDTIPWQHTVDYYIGLSAVANSITMVTAVSRASATALETYLPMHTPIRVIPNIVLAPDANHQSKSIKKGDFVVGSLARLDLEKDIETLLLAVRAAIQEQAQIRLLVFGDGPLRDRLETLAHSLKLNDHVEFRGAYTKNDLTKIMTEIDMVALSSHYEGFGVVLVEGMAFGKPVVATAVGGVVDVVEDGLSGFLVPARDPEALAEKILALSNDRQLYERMAHAARQRYLACFTPERVVPQYMALYKRMAA
jgi:glycosyltransferase involved in cell wall biosynthesis